MKTKSMLMSSLKKNEDYKKAVQFIESKIKSGTELSTEFRNQFFAIIYSSLDSSLVGNSIKDQINYRTPKYDDKVLDAIVSNFCDYYILEFSEICNQLLAFCKTSQNAIEDFLEWLLYYRIKEIITEFNKEKVKSHINVISLDTKENSHDDSKNNGRIDFYSFIQYLSNRETNTPDSYEKDKSERAKNPKEFSQKLVVESALDLISEKMRQENWRIKIQSKIPGIQMYPYLVKQFPYITLINEDIFQDLLNNVLDFVAQNHTAEIDFNSSEYIDELHHYAQIRLDETIQKCKKREERTRNNSKNHIDCTRRLLNLLKDKWLSPLDKYDIAKLCNVEITNAEKLISRYKNNTLDNIYIIKLILKG